MSPEVDVSQEPRGPAKALVAGHRVFFGIYLTLVAGQALGLLAGVTIPEAWLDVSWPVTSAWLLLIQVLVASHGALPRGVRRAWAFFAAASLCTVGADFSWVLLGADSELSTWFSVADSTLCAVGLLGFPGAWPERGRRGRTLLDLSLVLLAAVVAMWDTMLRPVLEADHAGPLEAALAGSSPVTDFMLLVGSAALLLRGPDRATGSALAWIASSLVCYVIVDALWAAESLNGTYVAGGWLDWGWHLSRVLWAVAAWRQIQTVDRPALPSAVELALRGLVSALPLLATGLGFFFILRIVASESMSQGLWGTGVGAVGLCLLVLVRQTHGVIVQARLNARLEVEKARRDRLLRNILPERIAARLSDAERREPIAESCPEATVLFSDLVGFTELSARIPPEQLVSLLDHVFSAFDTLADAHGLEKIKTIGDAYMAAAGVPEPRPDHVEAAARMALAMRDAIPRLSEALDVSLAVRIGLHTGPVVAGVIGYRKFIYDLWGDTVNTASRMESHGLSGAVHISAEVAARLPPTFRVERLGPREIKGKGRMETYLLVS